jgi:methionyl-tRNA synthetase
MILTKKTDKTFFVTTPIYYVNAEPHIGTAYTSIAADALARFMRLDGYEVFFLTGTDEYGQKIAKAAQDVGLSPQAYVDQMELHFRQMYQELQLTPDDFIRTTEPRHKKSAQALWKKLVENKQIYKDVYKGWYSIRDETFYTEVELIDGKAPTGAEVHWVEEPSYFFKLSEWQKPLLAFYDANPNFIAPKSRRNEVIRFVESGLHDLSVSRSTFKWGIPVPGDPDHVMYVWVEALSNYITALGYPDMTSEKFQKFWPESLHLVGKDILRFHAVYWPALLMAAGLTPPKRVYAHGWWTIEGHKMSKSLGNVINPIELTNEVGLDQVRYFLLREISFGSDGDFSRAALKQRINSDLANDFGNLVQRVLSFIYKNCDARIPSPASCMPEDQKMLDLAKKLPDLLRQAAKQQEFHKMLESIWEVVGAANRYVDEQAPWALKKIDLERMGTVLYVLAEVIRHLAILASPFVPIAAAKILDTLGVSDDKRKIMDLSEPLAAGMTIAEPHGVFPRVMMES